MSRQVNMGMNRIDFPNRISWQVMQRGEPELQFTPNIQCHEGCRAIRSRCSCLQRPSLKIRLQLQLHRRADMVHEPSQRAFIIISQCRRHFIIRLVLGRNLCCPRSSRFNRLSYPPYHSNISQLVSQITTVVPPPAATGFPSAPIHSATSFQPHPGRFDVSAPGMSEDA